MAKPTALSSQDLVAGKRAKPRSAGTQRGAVPSAALKPLQFKMPEDFVRRFKEEALRRGLKLNQLLEYCFDEIMK